MLKKVWLIPILSLTFALMAFLCGYIIAVSEGHVHAIWPFISDTGTLPPESSIFSLFLNLSALFLAISVYLRHRQIVEFYWHRHRIEGMWRCVSRLFLFLGLISALGVSIVANFQQHEAILYIHYCGALTAFGGGLIYAWGQTIFSYIMSPKLVSKLISHIRFFLSAIATTAFFTMIVFGCILGRYDGDNTTSEGYHLFAWTSDIPNYVEHTIGTCSEWVLAICFEIYIVTFAIELYGSTLHGPKLDIESVIVKCKCNDDTKSCCSKATEDTEASDGQPVSFIKLPEDKKKQKC
uniref:DNA damage-regulated autophagy modulator protein 2 n=1 Tax=Strongyloides venezuelensis TaxID=75913 RepID=A0A0K0EWB5_STRVS